MTFPLSCAALMAATLVAAPPLTARAAGADGYRLGAQDKLEIRVYDLRTGSGETHQWAALNGEFVVNAAGAVSLPLLGEVPADGETPANLANAIATRLQAKIGLAQLPDASVQVVKYRPFYVVGAVERAGDYEYRPGLTVLQATAMAGGIVRASDASLLGYERDALSQRGELRVLASDRIALLVRQARLDAEVADADLIAVPPEVQARAAEPDVARAVREEQLLFDARRGALRSQIESIKQAKALLSSELNSLAAKDATLGHQLDLTRKELAQITDLVSRGIAVMPRQLAAEQSTAAFESSRLDVQLAALRAQQDLARADRDLLDLRARRRDEALTEATQVRAKLRADAERISTAQALIYDSEVRAPMTIARDGAERQPVYVLMHQEGGASQTHPAAEGDPVAPGDVLKVLVPRRAEPTDARERLMSSGAPAEPAGRSDAAALPGGPGREAYAAPAVRH